jgi:hypothetical protein
MLRICLSGRSKRRKQPERYVPFFEENVENIIDNFFKVGYIHKLGGHVNVI